MEEEGNKEAYVALSSLAKIVGNRSAWCLWLGGFGFSLSLFGLLGLLSRLSNLFCGRFLRGIIFSASLPLVLAFRRLNACLLGFFIRSILLGGFLGFCPRLRVLLCIVFLDDAKQCMTCHHIEREKKIN